MSPAGDRPEWATAAYPEIRSGPPWVMSDMVAAQRELPGPILAHPAAALIAAAVAEAAAAGEPVVVTGCGTSEHAALAAGTLIADALGERGTVLVRQSFNLACDPSPHLCIAVSHGGTSSATVAALEAVARAGGRTCLITAASASNAHVVADLVFPTPLDDASWCHTVAYTSPMLAGAAIAASLAGTTLDPDALSAHIAACDAAVADLGAAAARLSALARLLAVGSGVDATTASEQALKIEEGAWIPTTYLQLETLLHGHLPGADERSGLVAFLLDPLSFAERAARTRQALAAAAAIGITTLLVTSEEAPTELREAADETAVLPAAGALGRLGALLGGAVALQRLTLAFAGARGTNPDLLRRDDERYRRAALLGAHKLKPFAPSP